LAAVEPGVVDCVAGGFAVVPDVPVCALATGTCSAIPIPNTYMDSNVSFFMTGILPSKMQTYKLNSRNTIAN
jgi:hypothetical protein